MAIYKDLTVLFTLLVIKAPLVLHIAEHGLTNILQVFAKYLLSPTMLASYAYLYMVVKVANSGSPVQLSERDRRVATWFLLNGVYFNLFLDVFSGQFQANDLMTFQYNIVEPRYVYGPEDVRGMSVFWTSMCELFFQSPFCILAYYGYKQGKAWRRPLEIIVSVLHIAGVWWFYVPEAYAGFPHLGGWPKPHERFNFHNLFYFWFGFWFMSALWTSVAFMIAKTAFMEIAAIIEKHDTGKAR